MGVGYGDGQRVGGIGAIWRGTRQQTFHHGADLILVATACPHCESNLGAAPGERSIPVRNVIDLLAESLGV